MWIGTLYEAMEEDIDQIHFLHYWSTTNSSIPQETSTMNSPGSNFSFKTITFKVFLAVFYFLQLKRS